MKIYRYYIVVILLISCSSNKLIITPNSVGQLKIGQKIDSNIYDKGLEIQTDDSQFIESIMVKNKKYKTIDSFGVGTQLIEIKKKKHKKINKLKLKKGESEIGILGESIVFNDITFIDLDSDGIVDLVWVQKK